MIKMGRLMFIAKYFFDSIKYQFNKNKVSLIKINAFFLENAKGDYKTIIEPKDIDKEAEFIADPFMIHNKNKIYVFFEVFKNNKEKFIGVCSSRDYKNFKYLGKCLGGKNIKLSYPYIIKDKNTYYMFPEQQTKNKKRLNHVYYTSNDEFPFKWKKKAELFKTKNEEINDKIVFKHNNTWFMFYGSGGRKLLCAYSDSLEKGWKQHPQNPILLGKKLPTRPGGNLFRLNKWLMVFLQKEKNNEYGKEVYPLLIKYLSKDKIKAVMGESINTNIIENEEEVTRLHTFCLEKNKDKLIYLIDVFRKNKNWAIAMRVTKNEKR